MRQIAATPRRDRLLQPIASCDMWKSLSLWFVARIQTRLNSCDIATYRSDKIVKAAVQTRRTCRSDDATCRDDVSPRFVASCVSTFIVYEKQTQILIPK